MAILEKAVTEQRLVPIEKNNVVNKVVRVNPDSEGIVHLKQTHGALKSVDVADVDLVLGFADGTYIIIPNGALDAIAGTGEKVKFADDSVENLVDLFKQVGHVDAADAGNLRIISENIDTRLRSAGESDSDVDVDYIALNQSVAANAPAAPLPKATSSAAASPISRGAGSGRFDTENLDAIIPPRIDQPTQYRVGVKIPEIQPPGDITIGVPDIQAQLFVSKEFKVDPSFRSNLPVGATDSTSEAQATREQINVTNTAGSTIDRNTDFASATQWSKTLHLSIAGYDSLTTVEIGLADGSLPAGFNLTNIAGTNGLVTYGPSVNNPLVNVWKIDPSAFTLQSDGTLTADINVLYNLTPDGFNVSNTSFQLLVQVDGQSGQFNFQSNGSLFFNYIDPATDADYLGVTSSGKPIFILPARGVGYDIYGNVGNDNISSGAGKDYVNGGDGNDTINGDAGNDTLMGADGNDALNGGTGDDSLNGGAGIDTLTGGDGNDTLVGGGDADVLDGGNGTDTASYRSSTSGLTVSMTTPSDGTGDALGDTFISIENLEGSAFNDKLIGNSSNNQIFGLDGDDTLEGMGGADTLDGGNGNNTLSFEHSTAGVTATFTNGLLDATSTAIVNTGDAAGDTYINLQNIIGSNQADYLIGNTSANSLQGLAGNDTLEGISGGDTLDGGADIDTASYLHATSAVNASLSSGTAAITNGNGTDTLIAIENLQGTGFNDTLTGDNGANSLSGEDGNDSLVGLDGNDTLNGGNGNDTLIGGAGADVLIGGAGAADVASYRTALETVSGNGIGVIASLIPVTGVTTTNDAAGDTYSGIEVLEGSNYNDQLIGDNNANTLLGGDGNDTLEGLNGADVLNGGTGINTASYEHAGTAILASLTNSANNTGAAATGDTYINIQNLIGSINDDTLIGDSNANILNGGDGNDTLEGMGGADSLIGGAGTNTASYEHANAGVVATLTTLPGVTAIGDAAGDVYTNIQNLTGSAYADLLIGDGGANSISGGIGNDTLEGMAGADTLDGGLGNDTASYTHSSVGVVASMTTGLAGVTTSGDAAGDVYIGIETLEGSGFNDYLIGDATANTLLGGVGDDTLEGLAGADTLNGGSGTDTATYIHSASAVVASLTSGLSGVTASGDAAGDSYISIENLTGTVSDDLLIGDSNINVLDGSDGNDTLEGMGGADSLVGGSGTDTASYAHASTAVTASLTTGLGGVSNSGDAAGDTYSSIENLLGSAYADLLVGDTGNNSINGGAGNDTLEGLAGADTLDGGTSGTDTASYAHATVGVVASLSTSIGVTNTGDATGDVYVSIENLLGSDLDDNLIGDANVNLLSGGDGNDTLEGLGGADTLNGGDGIDTASYIHASGAVVATLTTGLSGVTVSGDANGDSYISIENLQGSNFNDMLIGDVNANSISGADGDDTLEGLGGADTLEGGSGTNTASYAHASTGVAASLTNSLISATGDAAGDVYSNIQNLLGSAYNDQLIGNGGANSISGGVGNDTLEGMAGADTLDGGTGNDTASYAHAADLGGGAGVVASMTASSAFTTGPAVVTTGDAAGDTYISIETLEGSGYNDYLIGNATANTLLGGAGDDTLEGLAGADSLNGGDGSDTATYIHATGGITASLTTGLVTATGDAIGDVYTSIENLYGSTFADNLIGDGNSNTLSGDAGNDTLEGMGGADVLDGGTGNDTATYAHATSAVIASMTTTFTAGPTVITSGDAAGDTYISIETLEGSTYNDYLIGEGSANYLSGIGGNDTLEGMGGADTLDGGTGNDTATYIHSTAGVVASMTTGLSGVTTTGDAAGDVYISIETLEGSTFNDYLIGSSAANYLSGNTGDDTLEGLAGADTLNGGDGSDTATYAHATSAIVASLTTGLVAATGDALGDTYISIENLTGSNYADQLVGDGNGNILSGGDGDDTLEGLGGADVLDGGNGNNTASYEHAGAPVVATLTTGLSGVTTAGDAVGDTYTNIQNLLGSVYADVLIGDGNANIISGGDGNDTLEGMDGADTLNGGAGSDTASYAHATGVIAGGVGIVAELSNVAGVTPTGDAIGDVYNSIENLSGSIGNDALYGDGNVNILSGADGDDTLEGMGGADVLNGGNGTDTASYIHSTIGVIASMTTGLVSTTGDAAGDTYNSIEILEGSNFADQLIGDGNANIINGGVGDDTLEGMDGADTLNGGTGTNMASYEHAPTGGVVAVLDAAAALAVTGAAVTATGHAAGDVYTDIQNLRGSAYADRLVGDNNNNAIYGGGSGDILEGLDGNDSLYGEAGDDTLIGGLGADVLDGSTGTDIASYRYSTTGITASLITPSSNTGEAVGDSYINIEGLEGSAFADNLTGDDNANILIGGAGDDTLTGGVGNDTIYGDAGNDTANFAGLAAVTVVLDATGNGTATSASGNDTLFSIENLIGTSQNDSFTMGILPTAGNGGVIDGGNGTDTVIYSVGTTQVVANLTTGVVNGQTVLSNIENLTGASGNDSLTGTTTANVLNGGDGDDTLIGGGGSDTLTGGNGVDTASFAGIATGITVVLNAVGNSTTTSGGAAGVSMTSIENIIGTDQNDSITLSILPTASTGGIVNGGLGTDTLIYSVGTTAVVADLGTGIVNGIAGRAISIENLTTSAGNDSITGSAVANILISNDGDDTIDGGDGNDTIDAGNGNDSVLGGNGTDSITAGAGNDYVDGGAANDTIVGGTGLDTLYGGDGNDLIYGGNDTTGTDTGLNNIYGGDGNDTIYGGNNGNVIYGDNSDGTGTGNDSIIGGSASDTLYGGLGNDWLDGGSGTIADTLYGGDGDDTLTGGAGGDVLEGGSDNDTARYTSAVYVQLTGTGTMAALGSYDVATGGESTVAGFIAYTGDAAGDTLTNIENLLVTAGNSFLIGDSGANVLTGGSGNDTLEGMGGNDTLIGGGGTDTVTYIHSTTAVNASLALGSATVTGGNSDGVDTLTNIRHLIGTYYNDALTGDTNANILRGGEGNDTLTGNNGADSLYGGIGNDTIYGGADATGAGDGNDLIYGGQGADLVYGGDGNDTIYGDDTITGGTGTGNDTIYGGAGTDLIYGGDGNDSLIGGAGNDTLDGGNGNDWIDARNGKDSVTGGAGNDTIYGSVNAAGGPNFNDRFTSVNGGSGTDTLYLEGFVGGQVYSLSTLTGIVSQIENINIKDDGIATDFHVDSASILAISNNTAGSVASPALTIVGAATNDTFSIDLTSGQYVRDSANNLVSVSNLGGANDETYTIYNSSNTALATVHWQAT